MKKLSYFTFLFIVMCTCAIADTYYVDIDCPDKELKKACVLSSETLLIKDKISMSAFRRRAVNDTEKFEELAHYYGYYSAKLSYSIVNSNQIVFRFDLGPKYRLQSCHIILDSAVQDAKAVQDPESESPVMGAEHSHKAKAPPITSDYGSGGCADLASSTAESRIKADANDEVLPSLKDLKLQKGQPITTQELLDAEKALLWQLKKKGYASATVTKKDYIANTTDHTLAVTFHVHTGQLVHFGHTQIIGSNKVLEDTIKKYITWRYGALYSPAEIENTQEQLEKTGLFSSVIITQDEANIDHDTLPLTINVQESKHKSIAAGVAYATSFGPGVKAEWENKNLQGTGDKLRFRTEVWEKYQTVLLSLTKPHFHGADQDLLWVAEYDKLKNIAFDSTSYNLSGMLQKRLDAHTETMGGLRAEWLHSNNFEGTQTYQLIKLPMQCKWSNANNLLDPTKGETLNIKLTPSTNFIRPGFFYAIHTSTLTGYHSLFSNRLTLAAKVVFGNIMGAARDTIPPPDRFYGGSENVLRGFKAYTVSPLHNKRTPIGGRSMLAASFEARLRTASDFGYVLFYDLGNVYSKNVPELRLKQFHSVGAGLRYATPIGPLRFDVAVPLNPRPHIDPHFQIYFSIGQSF
ncbi:MAG: BamA/TamA family outer membrane protein [Chlamydiales bacterium]|nr:BamA/TamA family outer membrane protein [Chlamydiales bacterium]